MNKPILPLALIAVILASCAVPPKAASKRPAKPDWPVGKPVAPARLPGNGLAQHDFFYAGEARSRDMFLVRDGRIVWSYHHNPGGKGEISDAVRLSNGNILFAHQFGVTLISPQKQVLWNYGAPEDTEIHTAQPIGRERVLFIQNGDPAVVVVANIVTGKIERQFTLPVKNSKKIHGQFRHARLTDAGTLLVAHMDLKRVSEYDEHGRRVWTLKLDATPWSAARLKNGNTLICGSDFTREVTPRGQTVWELKSSDIAAYKFNQRQLAIRLPNGNTLINNWLNLWSAKLDPATAPVQALEVTPDKQIVWALRSWTHPALGPSTTIQLLDEPSTPEAVHFGSIQ